MRVQRDLEGVGFRAFDITLTVDSEEEARALYAIFNYSPNVDLLGGDIGERIRKVIGEHFGRLGSDSQIANGITYREFFSHKEKP